MAKVLYVGDVDEYLAKVAQSSCPEAILIDRNNYEWWIDTKQSAVAYTSLGDLPKITESRSIFHEVLQAADEIFYAPPVQWSDYSNDFCLYDSECLTCFLLHEINRTKNNVHGLILTKYSPTCYLQLQQHRPPGDQPQLWFTGCSITEGFGIDPCNRYSQLLANRISNGKFVDLSCRATSLDWQADQVLRSDIRGGDTVIWGLTCEYRAVVWDHEMSQPAFLHSYNFPYQKPNAADDICDETRLYKAVISCYQVANYCAKIGANLFMFPMISSEKLQLALHDHERFFQLPYQCCFLDFGTDNLHPGPKHHQWYAEEISKVLEKHNIF